MNEINFVKKLALWVFIIPFIATNSCLLLVTVFGEYLPPGIRIGKVFPYFDGGTSISRTARNFPAYLIFKPAMIFTSFLLIKYWLITKKIVKNIDYNQQISNYFVIFGILSAIFLIVHSIFLGVKFDYDLYKFFRRFVLLAFIIFEIVAQSLLVFRLFKLKSSIKNYFNNYALILKIILVSILVVVAIFSLPIVVTSGNVHFKHALEWNYFVGVILFYFLTYLFWKRV